ncbi:hypothetical protein CPB86DRAFT_739413 [Serendipita vermifera]|nr:hypothetical protein CPB86DRAFT_739413 [Serendipita vermifera]
MARWDAAPSSPLFYVLYCAVIVLVLKEVNSIVWDPYMDEPFHAPQAQAYCEGKWDVWDPKITTPPGLYLSTALLRKIFMFKCRLPLLRLVPALHLLSLPAILSVLEAYHQRLPPPSDISSPTISSVALASFPPLWFFGFLYYTDVPGIAFILSSFVAQSNGSNWLACLLGLWSLFFRQTNIIWILYIFAFHNVFKLRWAREASNNLHDPPALRASFVDLGRSIWSIVWAIPSLLIEFLPYGLLSLAFAVFVVWNGGIVLGDKSNHIPALHIPQLFYFYAFSTAFGWPVLLFSGTGKTAGPVGLIKEVVSRMVGTPRRVAMSVLWTALIATCVHFFTIHHPFILSDNRHYTFYVWKRILFAHPLISYALSPVYLACWWMWWIRAGSAQSLLQTILLPLALIPTLLPSPLLEPRYFIVPYILLRLQVQPYDEEEAAVPSTSKTPATSQSSKQKGKQGQKGLIDWAIYLPWIELAWYSLVNYATMYIFLYKERVVQMPAGEEVIRFMW